MARDKENGSFAEQKFPGEVAAPFCYKWCSDQLLPLVKIHSAEIAQRK